MAAADYYQTHQPQQHQPSPPALSFLAPPGPQRASSNPGYVYSQQQPSPSSQQQQYFAPPPYHDPSKPQPQVHFSQSPGQQPVRLEQRNSFSHPQRPSPLQNQVQQMPYNPNIPVFAPQAPPPWQHGAYNPNVRPYNGVNQSQTSLNSGYSSDPEHHRRHHHRHRHSDTSGSKRDVSPRKHRKSDASRGTTTDSLIGATSGGLIGELIFPGLGALGAVGGALAGWVGGKDYSRHKMRKEEERARAQEKWERRYGGNRNLSPGDYDNDQDRSRSRDKRRRSHE